MRQFYPTAAALGYGLLPNRWDFRTAEKKEKGNTDPSTCPRLPSFFCRGLLALCIPTSSVVFLFASLFTGGA